MSVPIRDGGGSEVSTGKPDSRYSGDSMTPYRMGENIKSKFKEYPGAGRDNPLIMAMLTLDVDWPEHDEVAWCSAAPNFIHFCLGLDRSKSLMARSWLSFGRPVDLADARIGFDLVVLSREGNPEWGHVGYYSGHSGNRIYIFGGNQSDEMNVSPFDLRRLLSIRRFG